ncbi:hypothetical protein Tco_0128788 [Tanacetum coccineum]
MVNGSEMMKECFEASGKELGAVSWDCRLWFTDEGLLCIELILVATKPVPVSQAENPPFIIRTRFSIEESIDSGFARFNTIITSLKALDEGFSRKNYVRKFLRALHPKWRAKVTKIKESKDLSSLTLDELIGNLKVYEVVMKKDSEIYKGKKERAKSIALKAKKESSDDETCLIAQSSNEVTHNSSYYSDNASSLDNDTMQIEYDSLCEISLKIISKNKTLKTKRDLLEKEVLEWNEKIKKLERSKEIDIACKSCQELNLENAKLKETQIKFVKFDKSANSLREMLNNQKSSSCKIGLGFDSSKASTSETKLMGFVGSFAEKATDESTIKAHRSTIPGSVCLRTCLEPDEWIKDSDCSKHMTDSKSLFSTYKAYDEESLNVAFDESPHPIKLSPLVDDDVGEEEAIKNNTKVVNNNEEDESIEVDEVVNIKESKNHQLDQVIGNLNQITLRSQAQNNSVGPLESDIMFIKLN